MLHDHDAVREPVDHRKIVGHEQACEAHLGLQFLEQAQHRGLHGHVQGRGRLVGDKKLGLQRQCPGNPHTLFLATGEFMRVTVAIVARQPHLVQQLFDPVLQLLSLGHSGQEHGFTNGFTDRQPRVQ